MAEASEVEREFDSGGVEFRARLKRDPRDPSIGPFLLLGPTLWTDWNSLYVIKAASSFRTQKWKWKTVRCKSDVISPLRSALALF